MSVNIAWSPAVKENAYSEYRFRESVLFFNVNKKLIVITYIPFLVITNQPVTLHSFSF